MSVKGKLDLQDAKSVTISTICLFSPVIYVFLEQAQTMQFDWKILWAMAVWIVLKTVQKFLEHNPK